MTTRTFTTTLVALLAVTTGCTSTAFEPLDESGDRGPRAQAYYEPAPDDTDRDSYEDADPGSDEGEMDTGDGDLGGTDPEDEAGPYDGSETYMIVLETWLYGPDGTLAEEDLCVGEVEVVIDQDQVGIGGACEFYKMDPFLLKLTGELDGALVLDGETTLAFSGADYDGSWTGGVGADGVFQLRIDDAFEYEVGRDAYATMEYAGVLKAL